MNEYNFRLLLDVTGELSDDDLNALYKATKSDATLGSDDDGWSAEFDREASSYAKAVLSAIGQLEGAKVGVRVRKLISDDDALVSASEIGRRAGLTRQAVNLYVDGDRNRELGPFPAPLAKFASGQRIWRWGDVAPWIARATKKQVVRIQDANVAAVINDYLDMRRRMPHVPADARKAVATAVENDFAALSA